MLKIIIITIIRDATYYNIIVLCYNTLLRQNPQNTSAYGALFYSRISFGKAITIFCHG